MTTSPRCSAPLPPSCSGSRSALLPRLLPALLLLFALPLTGCFDNTGGPPPDGVALEEYGRVDTGDLWCGDFADAAWLIHDEAEAQEFLDIDCANGSGDGQGLLDAAAALTDGQALVALSIQLGGCLGEWGVFGFYEDEAVITAWVLRGDSSYGRNRVACPADIGGDFEVWTVDGAANATAATLEVGVFNPSSPGAPALPG